MAVIPRLVPSLFALITLGVATLVVPAASSAQEGPQLVVEDTTRQGAAPVIEVAILLDTSNSMDGLIDQARRHLWGIVNDLATTTRDGRAPDIRVALYQYGNSGLTGEQQWIEQVLPLTDDLDAVSESLFALRTAGGDEYCGAVIAHAVDALQWSTGEHYRALFIAGNEAFTQGPVDYREAASAAIGQGIVVNTIHCGDATQGRSGEWDQAARLADGEHFNIDHNHSAVTIAASQDAAIARLNRELNATYVAYGAEGAARRERQVAQDANAAASAPAVVAERAAVKSGRAYRNADWDLVDAVGEGEVELAELAEDALPDELRAMDLEQRAAFLAERRAERERVQAELRELTARRAEWVAAERQRRGLDEAATFGAAVCTGLREQLDAAGYELAE